MIEAYLYDVDGTTLISAIGDVVDVKWLDEVDGHGSGSITVHAENPIVDELTYRRVVKVRVDGQIRGAFLLKKRTVDVVADDDAGRLVAVSGPGLMAWFDDALVYQEYQYRSSLIDRVWDFGNLPAERDDFDWREPAAARYDTSTSATRTRGGPPSGWPRDTSGAAYPRTWLWAQPGTVQPQGTVWFGGTFTLAAPSPVTLFVSSSTAYGTSINGATTNARSGETTFTNTTEIGRAKLPAGTHRISLWANTRQFSPRFAAILCTNDRWSGAAVPAANIIPIDWKCLAYPDDPPGWPIGLVLSTLLDEAVTRGVITLGAITPTWTDTTDSDGVDWAMPVFSAKIGETYASVLKRYRDLGVTFVLDPDTLELHGYQTFGTDRSASVVIDATAHVTSSSVDVAWSAVNALMVRQCDRTTGDVDLAGIEAYGRVEQFVDLSQYGPSIAAEVSAEILTKSAIPEEQVDVEFQPVDGCVPWLDFVPGDSISVSAEDGSHRSRVVKSLSVTVDSAGNAVYAVELDKVSKSLIERVAEQVGLGGGTSGAGADDYDLPPGPGEGGGYRCSSAPLWPPEDTNNDDAIEWDDPGLTEDQTTFGDCCQPPGGSVSGGGGESGVEDEAADDAKEIYPFNGTVALLDGSLNEVSDVYYARASAPMADDGYGRLTNNADIEWTVTAATSHTVRYLRVYDEGGNPVATGPVAFRAASPGSLAVYMQMTSGSLTMSVE